MSVRNLVRRYRRRFDKYAFQLAHPSARPFAILPTRRPTNGPLRACAANPRYFADASGRPLLLTGSHTWRNLQDFGPTSAASFAYDRFLETLTTCGHNFFRLWLWEQAFGAVHTTATTINLPLPYVRSGPGLALDGKSKFDLHRFNPEFFQRLHDRIDHARACGIYVSVMLFNGFSVGPKDGFPGNPWGGHPFNPANNINPELHDLARLADGTALHSLAFPKALALQEAFVRRVVETVCSFDNVLFEISNESSRGSVAWQYHMIEFVRSCEQSQPHRHPVGMTSEFPSGNNDDLTGSPADWISPNASGGYDRDPPPASGDKVIVADTDHIWGVGGTPSWIWKCITRGINPVFMDPYDTPSSTSADTLPWRADMRRALGIGASFARRLDLGAMQPRGELSSQGYCLANPSRPTPFYLLFLPDERSVTVDLSATSGTLAVAWFSLHAELSLSGPTVQGGAEHTFLPPARGGHVLSISAVAED